MAYTSSSQTLGGGRVIDCPFPVFAGKNAEKGTASFACRVGKKAIECGAHAGNIVREVARVAGGAGGGKPDSAMAGAKDDSKIPEALKKASEIVGAMLLGKR